MMANYLSYGVRINLVMLLVNADRGLSNVDKVMLE